MNSRAAWMCHDARQPYTVVVHGIHGCGGGKPSFAIQFHGARVSLHVLDRHLRDYLTCEFEESDGGRLFLFAATYREFLAETEVVFVEEEYTFQKEGVVQFRKHHTQKGVVALRSRKMNMLWNWEPYPHFGDYDSMLEIRWVCHLDAV